MKEETIEIIRIITMSISILSIIAILMGAHYFIDGNTKYLAICELIAIALLIVQIFLLSIRINLENRANNTKDDETPTDAK